MAGTQNHHIVYHVLKVTQDGILLTVMALEKNFSTRISDLAALKKIAASLGYVQTRGKEKGEGSIRALLEAVASGELVLIRRTRTRNSHGIAIKQMAAEGLIEPADPTYRFKPFEPIRIEGEPLSETVIRERR
jgi:hypothetical protein